MVRIRQRRATESFKHAGARAPESRLLCRLVLGVCALWLLWGVPGARADAAPAPATAIADEESGPPPRPADADQRVRVRFWSSFTWGPPQAAIRTLVRRYNASQSRVWVDLLDVPAMEQKVFTATAGNVPPDIALFDRFRIAAYAARNAFTELDPHVGADGLRREEFFPATWDECVYRGKLYAIPFNTDVRVLYWNKEAFAAAGLDPERPPRTWNELREFSRKLTKRDASGALQRIGYVPVSGTLGNFGNTWLYMYGWQRGGEFMSADGNRVTTDDPNIVAALEWVTAFVNDYGAENLKAFNSGFGIKEMDPFLIGKMAMVGEEGFMLSRIQQYRPDLKYGVAPLPWPEEGRRATWSGGFALVMPKGARQPAEAMEFIRFLASKESQEYYGVRSAQIPAHAAAARHPFFTEHPAWRVMIEEMQYSRFRPVTEVGPLLWDELARANEAAVEGKSAPAEALRKARVRVQEELDRIRSVESLPVVPMGRVVAGVAALLVLVVGARAMTSARRVRELSLGRAEARAGYLFASPVIIGLLVFTVGPILASFVYSLCSYEVLTPARWIGVTNYARMFSSEDPLFWKSMSNTVFYTVFSVPLGVAGSLALAMMLNVNVRGKSLYRALFYLPSILPVVATSMVWLWLFNGEFGILNVIARALGGRAIPWLTSEDWSKPSMVLMSLWGVGAGMIVFLAALQGIPRHLYEAARLDGASAPQQFLHVTLPQLSPTIFFMLVINTIGAFQIFAQAYLMTNGQGTPLDSTLFYVFYLFRQGFEYFNMGYASALAWVMFLIIVCVTAIQFRVSKKLVYSEGARDE